MDLSNDTRLITRFWKHVDKSGECWLWTGCINRGGYGVINIAKKTQGAHRASYSIANGELEPGVQVDHTCFNRACVNPAHLRTVSHKQNSENRSGPTRRNKSGVRGVSWHSQAQKWWATAGSGGRKYSGGLYHTIEEAEAAVIELRNKIFTHNSLDRLAS